MEFFFLNIEYFFPLLHQNLKSMSFIKYFFFLLLIAKFAMGQNVVFTKDSKKYDIIFNSIEADGIYAVFADDVQKLNRRFELSMIDSFYCNNSAMVEAGFKSNSNYRSLFKIPNPTIPNYSNYSSVPFPSNNAQPVPNINTNLPSNYNLAQNNINNNLKAFQNIEGARLLSKGGEQIAIGTIIPIIGTLLGFAGILANGNSSSTSASGVALGILAFGGAQIIGTGFIISGGYNIQKAGLMFTQAQSAK